jgi:uncharacterized protein YqiB (DUF1249 family)
MDFNAYMACCTANYQRMHKLLPPHCPIGESLSWAIGKQGQLHVQLIQQQTHTDILNIKFQNGLSSKWLVDFEARVTLYHDARLAEVIALKDSQGVMQYFANPSSRKQFPYWEKWEMNHLFCDILSNCIKIPKNTSPKSI